MLSRMWSNLLKEPWAFAGLSAVVFLLILLAIGQQLIAISATFIATDSAALLSSPSCGVWFSEHFSNPSIRFSYEYQDDDPPAPIFFSNLPNDRAEMAVAYAKTCYADDAQDNECAVFYKPRIPFMENHNASCPFAEGTCLYGATGSYELDTGYLDSSVLGINKRSDANLGFSLSARLFPQKSRTSDQSRARKKDREMFLIILADSMSGIIETQTNTSP